MIGPTVLQYLHAAVKIYDNLVDKDYLIICQEGKQHPASHMVFRIRKYNFWHLLGCKVIGNTENNVIIL